MSASLIAPDRDVAVADAQATSTDDCAIRLDTNIDHGLEPSEASVRLKRFGQNELQETGREAWWQILLRQFTSTLILILVAAAVIAALVGSAGDTITILTNVTTGACVFPSRQRPASRPNRPDTYQRLPIS